MTLRTLNYGNYGIFLIMGHAGFCPSAVVVSRGSLCAAGSQSAREFREGWGVVGSKTSPRRQGSVPKGTCSNLA